ncbi:restriction endonuclease subunit S [Agrobacterium vitis]|uniref:restriction endonuclease subunit S n=1 Tax=Agrobacterium vitis TaxID=373 RepID=UPI003D284271
MSSKVKSSAATSGRPVLKPKLRFPEFKDSDGWKEIPLQKLASPVADRATTLDAENVLSLSGEHGLVLQSDYFGKKIAGDSTDRYLKIRKDDFVYNNRTTKASSYGTIKRLSNYSDGIVSPIYKCFRFQPSENSTFWEWYFESGSHDPALRGLINEGARAGRFNISVTQFLSTNAWRPDNAEQQKIADCLDSVNALIEAQGRKVEALKAHKKGLMQRLFPQEGDTQPRLRFPEFEGAGEWSEKNVDKIATIQSGATPSKANAEFWGGSIPWVSAKDMKRLFLEDSEQHISDEAVSNGARRVPKGTILILTRGMTLLKDVPICILSREMSFNQDVKGLRPKAGINGLFLAWMLLSSKDRLLDLVSIAGHGTGKIDSEELKALALRVPQLHEQQRIADCLTSLDNLIAAETQKLDALKTHKKGLMQQLFPQFGESDA